MTRSRMLALACGCAFLALVCPPRIEAAAASPAAPGLDPGALVTHTQVVPVRIALIGFGDEVSETDIRSWLPATYKPVVRYPRFYGLEGRDLGLEYQFEYTFEHKSAAFTKRFFAYLKAVGVAGPVAPYQQLYNDQANNVLEVTGPVLYIDAPLVEKWLLRNDPRVPALERQYTLYFVNWHGRSDFQFHVYTKTDEPDPDTRFNFGRLRGSRKMVSWGGTYSRSWFYDFSAGPEAWAGNFDVDDADLDGDGGPDYRIPPIWEYADTAYRHPASLSQDMGLLARFVGINLLFTSSPLYDPLASAPEPGGRKVAHVAMLEDEDGTSGLDWFRRPVALNAWRQLQPYYPWKVGLTDQSPIDAGAKLSLEIFAGNSAADECWNGFGTNPGGSPAFQLFCYFTGHFTTYVPVYPDRDHVSGIFAFNTSTDLGGLLGFADDNWEDGTPTHEFVFGSAELRAAGFGFTSTIVHELGHHIGLSHPHDGFDPDLDDYQASGPFYFTWLGDESDTVMQYIALSNGFGRHNEDNMYRWEMAGYLNWANALAGDLQSSPDPRGSRMAMRAADRQAQTAKTAFTRWDYLTAARNARDAYVTLKVEADRLGLTSPSLAELQRQASLGRGPKKDGCRPRYPNE